LKFDYVVLPAFILLFGILVIWLSVHRFRSLSTKSYRMWRKVSERIVLSIIVLLVAAVAGSSSFNAIANYYFWTKNPPPGSFYTVNGHKMRMYCMGSGSPTIILESGLGNDALIWGGVQPVLAKTTRVCSYDRAGLGWSEPVSGPRDADHIAGELHGLLLEAKITGPIVLMGHSLGGMIIRDYATRYPADIAGLVFVDSASPLQFQNPVLEAANANGPPIWALLLLYRSEWVLGVPRLVGACSQPVRGFEAHAAKLEAEALCDPPVWTAFREENAVTQSGLEAAHTGPFGVLPILIFSHDPAKYLPKQNPPKLYVDVQNELSRLQEDLKNLSTRSRRIVAQDSGHVIQLDRPDLLEKEVPPFIEQIRGTAPPPTSYGTTITE